MKNFWSRSRSAASSSHTAYAEAEAPLHETAAASARSEESPDTTAHPPSRHAVWRHLGANLARIPFASTLLAAYYCALDKNTPTRVRITLLGALSYFVMPVDAIPDFLTIVGFTDDASILMAAIMSVRQHILPKHKEAAEYALEKLKNG